MMTRSALTLLSLDTIVARALDRLMEPKPAPVLERILRPYHRARRNVEPIDQAGKQETQRGAARQQRERGALGTAQRPYLAIALQQRPPLGHIERMIGFKAPRIEADRDIV